MSQEMEMSAWRQEALKCLPQYQELIEQAHSVSELWADLWLEFQSAYRQEPKDEQTIECVYKFASWCWHGSDFAGNNIDLITAVFGFFYEPLPQDPNIRRDMYKWLCLNEFDILQGGPFTYFLNLDEHTLMVKEFRQEKAKHSFPAPERCEKLKLKSSR